jgi:hypothetical protein
MKVGEAKRRSMKDDQRSWTTSDEFRGVIELHLLPAVAELNGARLHALTGDDKIPETSGIILKAFRAVVGDRTFHVGHCIGNGEGFSAVGIAVIERLKMEVPEATLHVITITHEDIAWDIVLRSLRSFTGKVLLFAFANSQVYDAGTAEIHYSKYVRQFMDDTEIRRLTAADRRIVKVKAAAFYGEQPSARLYPAIGLEQELVPWVFRVVMPSGKVVHTAVWNGRRNYAHEIPENIVEWVGGGKIVIVQVDKPVGVNGRSSLKLTHVLSADFDGVIHWARDTETYESIVRSFARLDLESVASPKLSDDFHPEITIFAANDDDESVNAAG